MNMACIATIVVKAQAYYVLPPRWGYYNVAASALGFSGHPQLAIQTELLMTETIRHMASHGSSTPADLAGNGVSNGSGLVFKQATEPWEFQEIYQLNYASFVEEVPQHPTNDDRVLVDQFHDENTYFICRRGFDLLGMICARDRRPFSLDQKLGRFEDYLPQAEGARVCEIRLLAVRPNLRRTRVLPGLLTMMARHCQEGGYDYVVMSGRVSQQPLYRHIGFIPFGPVVGDDAAPYQPMYRPVGNVGSEFSGKFHEHVAAPPDDPVILTPGPVAMPRAVVQAFQRPPLSHRSPEFHELMRSVRQRLCDLTNANHCAVMVGSGTLANDVVAAQLSRLDAPGVIVTAGEFGERLLDHANRMAWNTWPCSTSGASRWTTTASSARWQPIPAAGCGRCIAKHPRARWPISSVSRPFAQSTRRASRSTASAASPRLRLTSMASGSPVGPAARDWPPIPASGWCSANSARP